MDPINTETFHAVMKLVEGQLEIKLSPTNLALLQRMAQRRLRKRGNGGDSADVIGEMIQAIDDIVARYIAAYPSSDEILPALEAHYGKLPDNAGPNEFQSLIANMAVEQHFDRLLNDE